MGSTFIRVIAFIARPALQAGTRVEMKVAAGGKMANATLQNLEAT